jgi:hypothetical protein
MDESRFTLFATAVPVVGLLLALVGAFVGSSVAFRGSIAVSALVGLVFAVHHLQSVRRTGAPQFATGAVVTGFGGWLVAAPLLYDVGFLPTASVQFSGLLLLTFGGHTALDAVAAWFRPQTG